MHYNVRCLHADVDEYEMGITMIWDEKNKSAYIQLKLLEDTWAFLLSFSLQLFGYCISLKLCVPNHAYSWEGLVGH